MPRSIDGEFRGLQARLLRLLASQGSWEGWRVLPSDLLAPPLDASTAYDPRIATWNRAGVWHAQIGRTVLRVEFADRDISRTSRIEPLYAELLAEVLDLDRLLEFADRHDANDPVGRLTSDLGLEWRQYGH